MNYKKIILFLIDLFFLPIFILLWLISYFLHKLKSKQDKPRLVFGPDPIINNKYWSMAMKEQGYESKTIVFDYYAINKKDDFDMYYNNFYIKLLGILNKLFVDYIVFFYALCKFEIFHFSFNGGFLQKRFFVNYLEFLVYKSFGKKTVILPYGSDIYQYSKIVDIPWKHALITNYPLYGKKDLQTQKRVSFIQNSADFIIAYIDYVFMLSYWDMLTVGAYIIDEDSWKYDRKINPSDGKNGLIKIAHAPNHRGVKGTEFVYEAVENLKRKGYNVELILIEKMKNDQVKKLLKQCDILIDQLNIGYALNAIEGMALSMPVITNLTNENYVKVFKQYSFLSECPLVSANFESLEQRLEELVVDPIFREALGQKGRNYIEKYHSKTTFFLMMNRIYEKIWYKKDINLINYFHPKIGLFFDDLNKIRKK